jgi:hypothetical protein
VVRKPGLKTHPACDDYDGNQPNLTSDKDDGGGSFPPKDASHDQPGGEK